MSNSDPTFSIEFRGSSGRNVLDHLAADGAGFAGGQMTVVAVGQVDTDLGGDTDTMGAIACAITGAHGGIQVIPTEVAKKICEQNPFGFEALAEELLLLRRTLM